MMVFQAAKDKSIMLDKKQVSKRNSICILLVVYSNSRQKLIAVNELRIVVYLYHECGMLRLNLFAQTQFKGCFVKIRFKRYSIWAN